MPYPITKRDGKYYVNGHGYRTRGQALAYQRALYAHMPESEKPKGKADNPAYQRGIQEETAEHPTMTPDIIAQLVKDHLRIDPNYYAAEEKFNPNHDPDNGQFAEGEGGGGGGGIASDLHQGKPVKVRTPEGTRFTIQPKTSAGVTGYAVIPEGKKRPGKHRIMNRDELDNWVRGLERDDKELVDAHGQTLHGPSAANASLYGPLSAPGVEPGRHSSIIRPIARRTKKKYLTPRPLPFWRKWGQRLKEGITVTHGGDGLRYMFIITSNSYPDREDETITTRALQEYVDQAWEDGSISQPLRWWHDDELPDIGKIVWADMEGPFLLELAQELPTKLSQIIFDYIEQHPDEHWAASHGFDFPEDDKTASGVYKKIYKFETSLLPLKAAANPYTMSAVVNERTL